MYHHAAALFKCYGFKKKRNYLFEILIIRAAMSIKNKCLAIQVPQDTVQSGGLNVKHFFFLL